MEKFRPDSGQNVGPLILVRALWLFTATRSCGRLSPASTSFSSWSHFSHPSTGKTVWQRPDNVALDVIVEATEPLCVRGGSEEKTERFTANGSFSGRLGAVQCSAAPCRPQRDALSQQAHALPVSGSPNRVGIELFGFLQRVMTSSLALSSHRDMI